MDNIYLGEKKIARIHHQGQVIYPEPVRDGLMLWHDFMGCTNSEPLKHIAEDLSGYDRDGELRNFAYSNGSGYGDGLIMDGIDDSIAGMSNGIFASECTMEVCFKLLQFKTYSKLIGDGQVWGLGTFLSTGTIRGYARTSLGGANANASNVGIAVGEKSIVTFVWKDGKIMLYKNGVEVQYSTQITTPGYPALPVTNRMYVGSSGSDDRNPNVEMYSCRAYNRALTPQEIMHNYQMEKERWNL